MNKNIFLAFLLLTSIIAQSTETKIIVRAKAKDAKFIGSSIGGAYVIIRNQTNQQIISEGITVGSTGNTNLIMNVPKKRGESIVDENTAKFIATIDIEEPTFISIEVRSPSNHKQSQIKAYTELWVIPGKDILGDGIILEIPGFIIDILEPRTHHYIPLKDVKNTPFQIKANMVMMCGCTIQKGGLWNSENIEVKTIIKKDGVYYKTIDMSLEIKNLFEGNVILTTTGNYELIVYAYDKRTGNTGVDKVNYIIYD